MKGNIFMMAAVAVLAMACAKEQPASVNPSEGLAEIRVSVPDTKVAIAEQTGVCTWQEGDKIAIFFASAVDEENEPTAGVRIEFTYDGLYEDGSAKFVSASELPAEYVSAEAVYPASSMSEAGKNSLVRDYVYDADSVPVYLVGDVVTNADGTLASSLEYNASVMKFTLHDIPAYAAGFVLETTKNEGATVIAIKTSFPYKTGYTADPEDHSNDIVIHSPAAHSSYVSRVYLVDGDGDMIEGSERKFKQTNNDISHNDYIIMPVIDFDKANLRKDYVKVCGIKWAKGNLVYDKNNAYHSTKSGVDDNFQTGWGLHDEQYKFINYNKGKGATYDNNENWFDHFNYGGIGRNAKFWSGSMLPSQAEYLISGKVWKGFETSDLGRDPNAAGTKLVELTGDDRFTAPDDAHYVKINNEQLCGDVAFWASKGKYRLPQKSEFQIISHFTTGEAAIQYGYYKEGDVKVYGILYTTPLGTRPAANKNDVEFDSADLECGLFIPKAGRRGPRIKEEVDGVSQYLKDKGNSKRIMALNQEACYLSGHFGAAPTSPSHQYYSQRENPRRLHIKENGDPVIGYTGGSQLNDIDGNYVDNTMSVRAGYSIRPVLVETAE